MLCIDSMAPTSSFPSILWKCAAKIYSTCTQGPTLDRVRPLSFLRNLVRLNQEQSKRSRRRGHCGGSRIQSVSCSCGRCGLHMAYECLYSALCCESSSVVPILSPHLDASHRLDGPKKSYTSIPMSRTQMPPFFCWKERNLFHQSHPALPNPVQELKLSPRHTLTTRRSLAVPSLK